MRAANALDFDDLLLWPALALKNDAELRAELDARFRYVLIDEYQDTNKAQYAIARGLSQDYPNLCVVGDPDQSIYKWRGADIRNILDFERDFPNARVITLSENFRSTQTILQRGRRTDRPQQAAQAEDADHRQPGRHPRCRCSSSRPPWTRPSRSSGGFEADVERGQARTTAISPCSCASTPCRATWKPPSSGPGCRSRSSAAWPSSTARKTRTSSPICGCCSIRATMCRSAASSTNRPAASARCRWSTCKPTPSRARSACSPPSARSTTSRPSRARRPAGLRASPKLIDELRKLLDAPPDEIIRQVIDRPATASCCQTSGDEDDQERLANIEELITAAKQFHAEDPTPDPRPISWKTSPWPATSTAGTRSRTASP